ncbi:hypothetical protein Tco_0396774 [Tanacetum coccineum]
MRDVGVKNGVFIPAGEKQRRILRVGEIRKKDSDDKVVLVIVAAAGWLVWFWGDDATKGGSENVVSSPAGYIPISSIMKDVNDNVVKNDGEAAAKISFASILQNQPSKKTVKITELYNNEVVEGGGVAMLLQWKEVSSRFTNTLYGYFIGKRLAFPLVRENYRAR